MNYNKEKFLDILNKIKDSYGSQNKMADALELSSSYITKIYDKNTKNPPAPEYLQKIANNSKGITSYEELMEICGYSKISLESKVYEIYENLKKFYEYISECDQKSDNLYELQGMVENFQDYLDILSKKLSSLDNSAILLTNVLDEQFLLEDYNYTCAFLLVYDNFLKCLRSEGYINIENYTFINWFNLENIYNSIHSFENYELLSLSSTSVYIKDNQDLDSLIKFVKNFITRFNLAYLSDFDSNALTELFKKKINAKTNLLLQECQNTQSLAASNNIQFYMCPVYGRISAGIPNWAEECMEGTLPIDPELMGILNPEEHFFLKVNGESMNKIVKNGAFALIHKQDIVENGEIAVVLVNGYDATLKKFTKQGDLVILEPQSNDESFETQVYDKTTSIKVLGKYVGKMEFNN